MSELNNIPEFLSKDTEVVGFVNEPKKYPKNNVYKKLQEVRTQIISKGLKRGGKAGGEKIRYNYFELADFLPTAIPIMNSVGLTTTFNVIEDAKGREIAVLDVINHDDPNDRTTFQIPTAEAMLAGGSKIQGLGAKLTYLRRYLYLNALDISEADIVEAATSNDITVSQYKYLLENLKKEQLDQFELAIGKPLAEWDTTTAEKAIGSLKKNSSRQPLNKTKDQKDPMNTVSPDII